MKTTITLLLSSIISISIYAQLNPIDSTYGLNGISRVDFNNGSLDTSTSSIIQSDGKLVIAGASDKKFALIRLNTDGSLDSTFGNAGKVVSSIYTKGYGMANDIIQQADGKLLAGGYWVDSGNVYQSKYAMARYLTNGDLDTTFGNQGLVFKSFIGSFGAYPGAKIQSLQLGQNAKIYAFGSSEENFNCWWMCGYTYIGGIARFNSNGQIDTTYHHPSSWIGKGFYDGYFNADDGFTKSVMLASGEFIVLNSASPLHVTNSVLQTSRYSSSFSKMDDKGIPLDSSFNFGIPPATPYLSYAGVGYFDAHDFDIQADGKIVAVGVERKYNVSDKIMLARFLANGNIDTSFGSMGVVITDLDSNFTEKGYTIRILSDGKILIGGSLDGKIVMIKYNPDGSLNSSCTSDHVFGPKGTINEIHMLPNGKIIMSGEDGKDMIAVRFNQWIEKSISINDSTCDSYNFNGQILSTSGHYIDTVQSTFGCDSIIYLDLEVLKVNDTITKSGNNLSANAMNASFQWIDCGTKNPLPGDTNQLFIASSNGNYAVIVTQNGCSDTSDCYSVTGLGISTLTSSDVKVYPNPNNGSFTIDLGQEVVETRLELINLQGQIVFQQLLNHLRSTQIEVDAPIGMYMIKLYSDDAVVMKKVLIE